MRFGGKTALVTGGRSGIGAAAADRLADEGARVFTAQRGLSARHESLQADFEDPAAPGRVVEAVRARAGGLDILVNCAGVMSEAPLAETSLEAWRRAIAVNLTAPFLLMKAAAPAMPRGGAIVNVGSIEGLGANPGHAAYCASKAGLHGLTRAAAVDLGPAGVRCNAVAPGWIDTDLNDAFIAAAPDPAAFRAGVSGVHPLRRTGAPQDVAALIAWLASSEAAFTTGQIYVVDGGRTAQLSLPRA